MSQYSQKLAAALEKLQRLQNDGVVAIASGMLERAERERLEKHGFIRKVIRGWYIAASPEVKQGESTPWYTSFWEFCRGYLDSRFESDWCLTPEQSIKLHTGDWSVPDQLLVRSPKGRNKPTALIHSTSILDMRLKLPPADHMTDINGIQVYSLPAALANSSPQAFRSSPVQMRAALAMQADASDVLAVLLEEGSAAAAGRLAGALRNIGRDSIANAIVKGMESAGYELKESDPFREPSPVMFTPRELSPYVNRLRLMWSEMREHIIANFPEPATGPIDWEQYLKQVDEIFNSDAYHSLSIEGYRVTPELIEMVRSGHWEHGANDTNNKHVDAMAARGYYDCFGKVKSAVQRVLPVEGGGENPGDVLEAELADWYFALFGPSVTAGIVKRSDLAGYRSGPVYIRQSLHTPPAKEAVRDMMPALFDLLRQEPSAAVRVVLGHFIFVFIHPYFDGNGRIGRFIMNLMLASGGYPWTVVPVERRTDYMQALEAASVGGDIVPFTRFLASLVDV